MSLNIKNAETYRLVKELAAATGTSMTSAVTDAVRRRLAEVRAERGDDAIDLERALALTADLRERLGADYLARDFDTELYDERGLPR
jgi:antitoxin VapB